MAGLDNIKSVAPDSSTEADTPDATETGALSAAGKTPQSKDKFLQGTPAANNPAAINEELLKNMQAMIAEREAQKRGFLSTMRDANAWWSGGVAGPGEALSRRALEKENESASIFNMKNQLAQYNALLGANANEAESLRQVGRASNTSAIPGAPGATAASNSKATVLMPAEARQEYDRLLSLRPPDTVGAKALLKSWANDSLKFNPGRTDQKEISFNGKKYDMFPHEIDYLNQTGQLPSRLSGQQAPAAPAVSGAPTLGPNSSAAAAAGIPVLSGYRDPAKQAALKAASQQPGYKGPPVAEPGHSLHQTDEAIDVPDYNALKPEQKKWLADNGYRQTFPKTSPNHLTKIPGIGAATSPSLPQQRAELQANVPFPGATIKSEIKANEEAIAKRAEKELEISAKGPSEASTEAGKRRAKMFELAKSTDDTVRAADMAIAASTSHPEATGIGKGKTGANALVTVAGFLPKLDKNKAEDIYASYQSDEAIKAREAIVGSSKQLGIDFAANVFKGARMGIGLENMAAAAKNVSEHNTAETNIINSKIIKEAALFNQARADLYQKWAPKNGGALANFEQFETSDEYKTLAKATQEKIAAALPQYLKIGPAGLEQTENGKKVTGTAEPSKFDQYRKKKTY